MREFCWTDLDKHLREHQALYYESLFDHICIENNDLHLCWENLSPHAAKIRLSLKFFKVGVRSKRKTRTSYISMLDEDRDVGRMAKDLPKVNVQKLIFFLKYLIYTIFFGSIGWCYENHNNNVWKLYFVSSVAKKNGKFYRHVASNLGCHEKILSETLIINLNWSCKLILQINRTKFDVALDPLSCTTTVGLFLLLSLFCKQWISNNRSCNKEHCLECYGVSVRYFVENDWNGIEQYM